ncbi:thermonuclease family protein [Devosia sp. I507]|uniref:thermonuclease family protein n=1 Tax=Devosia sp. I507 TaxID=2083786 RepID=UPI001AECD8F6|nr:thermonuclease family protein [Devosia sp. I507]
MFVVLLIRLYPNWELEPPTVPARFRQNLRLQSYDTPEPHDGICGGGAEIALANRASARLLQLLNTNPFTVETFGIDGTGERTLATIRIAGRDVGDFLIEEGLARRWPDGEEFWC